MYITADQAKAIHEALVIFFAKDGDPISPSGVKDLNMLESALFRPQTSIAGVEKYKTLDDKAAALLIALIQNHPFHNGNKRTALVSTLVFYDMNDYTLLLNEDETYEFLIDIAKGDLDGIDKTNEEFFNIVSRWLRYHKYPYLEKFNDKSIRISQSTKRISSAAIKSYFSELQLSQQYSGLRFDELVNGTFASTATFQKILPLMRKLALV